MRGLKFRGLGLGFFEKKMVTRVLESKACRQ